VKRFAQKEICYRTIREAKAVVRPAEITFFHKHANSEVNVAERMIYRVLGLVPGQGQVTFLAGAEPLVPLRDCGEEPTGLCTGS
jgi:hypothetical protein